MSAEKIAEVLAAHPPTYTEHANDPTTTFYCKPCSESIGDWVTWTPEHVAAALAPLMQAARADEWDKGYMAGWGSPYRAEGGQ